MAGFTELSMATVFGWVSGLWNPSASQLGVRPSEDGQDESDGYFIVNQLICVEQQAQQAVLSGPAAASTGYLELHSITYAPVVPLRK